MSWAAQTALRDIIGRTTLADLLRGREQIEQELQQLIDQRSTPWGVTVSVRRDARRRHSRARSRMRCRAKRRPRARSRRASSSARPRWRSRTRSEEAAKSYQDNPTALHLRAMNMLYEGLKEKGALMLIPSRAVEMLGAAALRQARSRAGGEPK